MLALIAGYAIAVAAASCWVARGLRGPADFLTGRRGLGVAQETPADPVLSGTLVSIGILAAGRVPSPRPGLHEA